MKQINEISNDVPPQKRCVINVSEECYDKVKKFCDKRKLKISRWVEAHLLEWIDERNKEDRTRCLVFRGSKEDLKTLNRDQKVNINGWGGEGSRSDENFWELYKHSLDKSEDLLLSYIIEYVKNTYPNVKISEFDFLTFKETKI